MFFPIFEFYQRDVLVYIPRDIPSTSVQDIRGDIHSTSVPDICLDIPSSGVPDICQDKVLQ